MKHFDWAMQIIDSNITYCLPYVIFTLVLIKKIFRRKYSTGQALNAVSFYIVGYTLFFTLLFKIYQGDLLRLIDYSASYNSINYLMLFSSTLLPLTLLFKKLRNKYWYVFIISFLLKIGVYFERFVIIITSIHRDSMADNWNSTTSSIFLIVIAIQFLQGAIIAIALVSIFNWIENKKKGNELSASLIDMETIGSNDEKI